MFEKEREALVENLVKWGYLTRPGIIAAFKNVLRHEFVPENVRGSAYSDHPLPIGHDQTISAPSMIAIMMETLDLKPGQKVLEIGSGSGYNVALLAEVVGTAGKVVTVERIPELARFANDNLKRAGHPDVKVLVGDGTLGHDEGAPWDRILITACAPSIPEPLIDQLAVGGKMGVPLGDHYMFQTWTVVEKMRDGMTKVNQHGGCSFVPLVGMHGWKK
jgi:protein-L-isoaspartate(D-aspartate) O-methyltransferase